MQSKAVIGIKMIDAVMARNIVLFSPQSIQSVTSLLCSGDVPVKI